MELKKYAVEELKGILEKHEKWLRDEERDRQMLEELRQIKFNLSEEGRLNLTYRLLFAGL